MCLTLDGLSHQECCSHLRENDCKSAFGTGGGGDRGTFMYDVTPPSLNDIQSTNHGVLALLA